MEFNFSKWQACGNDFVLVNAFNNEDISEIIANAEKICDRHFGVGADGVIFILPSKIADFVCKSSIVMAVKLKCVVMVYVALPNV